MFTDKQQDFVLSINETDIAVVRQIAPNTEREELIKTAQAIEETLKTELYIKTVIGIGTVANHLRELADSYKEAQVAIEVGKVFDTEKTIITYENLGIGRLIYQLPTTLCEIFLSEVFKKNSIDTLDQETLFTINKFFENNLNVSETSRKLFVHRNTLVYRLEKIKKLTGLDLREFDDAIIFKVALMETQRAESDKLILQMADEYASLSDEYKVAEQKEDDLSAQIKQKEAAYYNALSAEEAARIAEENKKNNNKVSSTSNSGKTTTATGGFLLPLPYYTEITDAYGMMSKRGMGKVSFCDIQDKTGRIQLYARKDEMDEESYDRFKKYDIGDIIGIDGEVFRTQRGEMSVRAKKITLLSKSLLPLPEKFHGVLDDLAVVFGGLLRRIGRKTGQFFL